MPVARPPRYAVPVKPNPRRLALPVLLLLIIVLSGCALLPNRDDGGGGGTGGDGGSGAGSGGGQPTPTVEPGLGETTEGELPANFPSDFPIVDGPVLLAVDLGTGWAVWIGADDPAVTFDAAVAALTAAGYTPVSVVDNETGHIGVFTTETMQVSILAGDDPTHGPALSYTIVKI